MKKFLLTVLFFFVILSPFSVFADETNEEEEKNSWDTLKQDIYDLDLQVGEYITHSDSPYVVTVDDGVMPFASYNYPSEIVYNNYDYYLCDVTGHDSCQQFTSERSSSNDWFHGSDNFLPSSLYGSVLPLTGGAYFDYNYHAISGSGSTSVGVGVSYRNSDGTWSTLFDSGGSVGRPSSGRFNASFHVDTSVSEWSSNLKEASGFRCFGGGGSNHGTQSCYGAITQYYYLVGPHSENNSVSLSVSPVGSGSVTGAGTYDYGSVATISATPNTGYVFQEWSDGNTDNPRDIIVNSNVSLTANFVKNQYSVSLSVSPAGSGSVTGSGTYEHGSVATISAIPNVDYVFKGWSDGNTDNPRNITVTSNVSLTANFEDLTYPQPPSPDITNNITNNIDQSTTINNNISFGSGSAGGGGGKVLFNQIDYYNLYSVYRVNFKQFVDSFGLKCNSSPSGDYTCEFDGYPDDISKGIKFEYVDTGDYLGGQYFFYIYDHSLLQARASNMLVSTDSITLDVCSPDNPDFCIKHSFALSDGAVARDVSEFNYEYVDGLNTYGYDRLANALTYQMTNKDKQVLFDYQGSVAKTSKSVLGSTSCMVSIYEKDGQSYSLNFAITDSVDTMNSINVQLNQKLEQTKQDLTNTELNQANQSLDKMNELLEVGNSQSQQSSNYLNSSNLELSNTINNYDNMEQGHLNDFSQNSAKIDTNFNFGDKFIRSARWVAIQFNNMTDNTPFGSLLQFSLLIGISLLIISKRL